MQQLPTSPGERPQESDASAEPEAAYTATATISEQGIVTEWSEDARRLLGYVPEEIVGTPAVRLLADGAGDAASRIPPGQERWSGTAVLRHRDGRPLEVGLLAHRWTSTGGNAKWFVVSAVAGGARTDRAEPLREWAFTQSPCVQAVFDADLRLVRANTCTEHALSLTEAEMRGLRLPEIVPDPLSEEIQRRMRLVRETGEPQHVDGFFHAPGAGTEQQGWATSLTPVRDPEGGVRAVFLTAHERTATGEDRQRVLLDGDRTARELDGARTAQEPAGELAATAAVSVHDARHHAREHTSTMALQRSLLPHTLPQQTALEIATRYLPAATEAGVGGDWFDVIPLSGARVALVVGDVVGHGMRAAATMGRVRTAVRTLADVDLPPDELLTHLDDLIIHLAADEADPDAAGESSGGIGTTCLYVVYDPVTRRCTVARAGHPPPAVVSPEGSVYLLDVPAGPPLGLGGLPFETAEVELPEGSVLALYTDGLLQARDHDIDEALDSLFTALARPASSLDAVCDRILTALLTHVPEDDVALLVARTQTLHSDQVVVWDLRSDPSVVADARRLATEQLTAWGLDEAAFVTELVVSELVTNAIRYGTPPVQLRLIHDKTTLICEVSDASNTAPHMRRARIFDEGGRGLLLVAQLAKRWGTRHAAIGKTIWAEQSLVDF
ncbi:SpoIIE family protein phosphatase [Streptomyces sp. NBC_00249]|uniref:SpoIIE family protein phosphatase n=1 Tax=Streptomyces sp. NBC_00249 TaxID=2975690 RepID=UPI0022570127|nr:SpoIIE family protein phosphatase [Streptomyces sp. NBC_00249]MCX5192836.1 SpoIIE family protein phosphatase [Streptomyces sp. NBC_00249]